MKNSYFNKVSLEIITFDGKSEQSFSSENHAKILLNWIKNGKIEADLKMMKSLEKGNLFSVIKPFLIKNMLLIQAPIGEFSFLPSIIHFSSNLSLMQKQRISEWLEYFHDSNLSFVINFYDSKLKKLFLIEDDKEIEQFLELMGFVSENSLKM